MNGWTWREDGFDFILGTFEVPCSKRSYESWASVMVKMNKMKTVTYVFYLFFGF